MKGDRRSSKPCTSSSRTRCRSHRRRASSAALAAGLGRSARRMPPTRLLVEPDVLHAPTVGDAVDHDRQPFHIGLPAAATSIVKNDWPGAVLCQLPFDLPNELLSLFLIGLSRLLIDQPVDLRTAMTIVVQIPAATIEQVKVLVGIGAASREVEADDIVLSHDLGEPKGAVDCVELAINIDLL